MTRGRKPRAAEVADVIDPQLDQPKIEGAMVQMRVDERTEAAARHLEIFDLGHKVGAVHMARLQQEFSAAAEVALFSEIQKSNAFKYLALPGPDGKSAVAENAEEFCRLVFGLSYSVMHERGQTLEAIGAAAYDNAVRLGLNRRQLRLVRALPEGQRETVQAALQSESRAEVVALVEDLAAQLAEAQEATAEAQADLEAKDHLLAEKGKRIDQLKAAQKRIEKLPPDEQLAELHKEATGLLSEVLVGLRGGLRQALIALKNHGDEDHSQFMAGLVGQVQASLIDLRDEFALPDTVGDGTPEWKRWVAAQDAGKIKASH